MNFGTLTFPGKSFVPGNIKAQKTEIMQLYSCQVKILDSLFFSLYNTYVMWMREERAVAQ